MISIGSLIILHEIANYRCVAMFALHVCFIRFILRNTFDSDEWFAIEISNIASDLACVDTLQYDHVLN